MSRLVSRSKLRPIWYEAPSGHGGFTGLQDPAETRTYGAVFAPPMVHVDYLSGLQDKGALSGFTHSRSLIQRHYDCIIPVSMSVPVHGVVFFFAQRGGFDRVRWHVRACAVCGLGNAWLPYLSRAAIRRRLTSLATHSHGSRH
jgi:hypothetical protein